MFQKPHTEMNEYSSGEEGWQSRRWEIGVGLGKLTKNMQRFGIKSD